MGISPFYNTHTPNNLPTCAGQKAFRWYAHKLYGNSDKLRNTYFFSRLLRASIVCSQNSLSITLSVSIVWSVSFHLRDIYCLPMANERANKFQWKVSQLRRVLFRPLRSSNSPSAHVHMKRTSQPNACARDRKSEKARTKKLPWLHSKSAHSEWLCAFLLLLLRSSVELQQMFKASMCSVWAKFVCAKSF